MIAISKDCFQKLHELRVKNGYTYKMMADLLNISKCYYWQIEHKQRGLTYLMALKIACIFKTKPDNIFLDEMENINS